MNNLSPFAKGMIAFAIIFNLLVMAITGFFAFKIIEHGGVEKVEALKTEIAGVQKAMENNWTFQNNMNQSLQKEMLFIFEKVAPDELKRRQEAAKIAYQKQQEAQKGASTKE